MEMSEMKYNVFKEMNRKKKINGMELSKHIWIF